MHVMTIPEGPKNVQDSEGANSNTSWSHFLWTFQVAETAGAAKQNSLRNPFFKARKNPRIKSAFVSE